MLPLGPFNSKNFVRPPVLSWWGQGNRARLGAVLLCSGLQLPASQGSGTSAARLLWVCGAINRPQPYLPPGLPSGSGRSARRTAGNLHLTLDRPAGSSGAFQACPCRCTAPGMRAGPPGLTRSQQPTFRVAVHTLCTKPASVSVPCCCSPCSASSSVTPHLLSSFPRFRAAPLTAAWAAPQTSCPGAVAAAAAIPAPAWAAAV